MVDPNTSEIAHLARRLREARQARNLTYRETAQQIGVSQSVVHQIEHGTDPRYSTATRVLAWLDKEN